MKKLSMIKANMPHTCWIPSAVKKVNMAMPASPASKMVLLPKLVMIKTAHIDEAPLTAPIT